MPYGITQFYLPPGSGDYPAFTTAKTGTRFIDPGEIQLYKAELTGVGVTSRDSLPAKDGHISEITGQYYGWELKPRPRRPND